MKNSKKGFTLIELLVVIAIIGILSAIVLASLSTARSKGKDATVQGQLSSARAQAEIYYGSNGNSYAGVCGALQTATPPGILTLLNATGNSNAIGAVTPVTTLATAGAYNAVTCHDSQTAWAAEGPLYGSVSGTPKMFCVDSSGASKSESAVLAGNAVACQ